MVSVSLIAIGGRGLFETGWPSALHGLAETVRLMDACPDVAVQLARGSRNSTGLSKS
jgi:hypothetical protein